MNESTSCRTSARMGQMVHFLLRPGPFLYCVLIVVRHLTKYTCYRFTARYPSAEQKKHTMKYVIQSMKKEITQTGKK